MSTEEKLDPRSMNTFTMSEQSGDSVETFDGVVRVHESVLCSIVRRTVSAIPGVVRFAGGSFVDSLAEMVGHNRHSFEKSVSVEMGESSVAIELRVVLEFGVAASDVCTEVAEAIVSAVRQMTGMTVTRVSVMVMDFDEKSVEEESVE